MKALIILLVLALTGCETCREYPTACATVSLVAARSIALSTGHRRAADRTPDYTIKPLDCSDGRCK